MNDGLNRARRLMATHPREFRMLVEPGQLAMLAGNYQQALSLFDQALKTAPNVADFLDIKAECLCHMSRFEEAKTIALKATSNDPTCASAWVNLSWAYAGLECYLECLDAALEGIWIEGAEEATVEQALSNAVLACCKLGEIDISLELIGSYLIRHPSSAHALKLRDTLRDIVRKIDGTGS